MNWYERLILTFDFYLFFFKFQVNECVVVSSPLTNAVEIWKPLKPEETTTNWIKQIWKPLYPDKTNLKTGGNC